MRVINLYSLLFLLHIFIYTFFFNVYAFSETQKCLTSGLYYILVIHHFFFQIHVVI